MKTKQLAAKTIGTIEIQISEETVSLWVVDLDGDKVVKVVVEVVVEIVVEVVVQIVVEVVVEVVIKGVA